MRWSDFHRLRKYTRKKQNSRGKLTWDINTKYYYRYWHKFYKHKCLWGTAVASNA